MLYQTLPRPEQPSLCTRATTPTNSGSPMIAAGATYEIHTVTDEESLIERVQEGHTDAFEQLYRQHVSRIYALCLRMTGNRPEAEDRTQEVFVKAWQKISSFEGRSSFHTWLHRIAVNLLISAHRKNTNKDRYEFSVEDTAQVQGAGVSDRTTQRLDLESAIAKLPERARMVFVLHDVEGYKHQEIASLTGMATGTSKVQAHRARKLLREMLA
jgi:RNA polymerase sigma-70 factor, ECF subfamily